MSAPNVEDVKKTVLQFVGKTIKEKREKNLPFYGDYYAGGHIGHSDPDRMVSISKGENDTFGVTYTCGFRMWTFEFSEAEISQFKNKENEQ